ncbi:MAG: hypothetical protein Q8P22_12405 [Chloroflexota bacterium]|nr:hypothetical protein [Chloroflexota bacterium]
MQGQRLSKQTGKLGELLVCSELLRRGVVPYIPLEDLEGVDIVIRRSDGTCADLQIKTIGGDKPNRWLQVWNLKPRPNSFIVGVMLPQDPVEVWIIPSAEFERYATRSADKKGIVIYDLDLDTAPRSDPGRKRREILSQYKDAWHLLTQGACTFLPSVDNAAWLRASEPAFAADWSSQEDEKYDEL